MKIEKENDDGEIWCECPNCHDGWYGTVDDTFCPHCGFDENNKIEDDDNYKEWLHEREIEYKHMAGIYNL